MVKLPLIKSANSNDENLAISITLFLVSLLFRLSLITKGPYHMDCLDLVIRAEETLKTGVLQFMYGSGYPVHVISASLGLLIGKIFKSTDPFFIVNFISVVYSSLTVPFIFGIGRIISKNTIGGIFAALIFTFNPLVLSESLYGTSHAPAIFFLAASVYNLLVFIEQGTKKRLVIAALLFGLLGATRLQDMTFMMVPIGFLWLYLFLSKNNNRSILSHALLFFAVSILAASLFYLPYLIFQREAYLSQWQRFKFDSLWVNDWWFYYDSIFKIQEFMLQAVSPLCISLSLVGFWYLWLRDKINFGLLMLWIIFPCVAYIFFSTTVMRFIILPATALMISAGYGLAYLYNLKSYLRIGTVICCIILITASLLPYVNLFYLRHSKDILPSYARWTSRITGPDAVVIAHDDKRFFSYFGKLEILHRPANFFYIPDEKLHTFKAELDKLLDREKPVYITLVGLLAYDPDKKFSEFFLSNYAIEEVGSALYDDWHLGGMYNRIFYLPLLKVTKR
jgi:hypothetical protein